MEKPKRITGHVDRVQSVAELTYQNRLLLTILNLRKLQIRDELLETTCHSISEIFFNELRSSLVGFVINGESIDKDAIYVFTPAGRASCQEFESPGGHGLPSDVCTSFEIAKTPGAETVRLIGRFCLGQLGKGMLIVDDILPPTSQDCPLIHELLDGLSAQFSHLETSRIENVGSVFFENNHAIMLLLDPVSGCLVDVNPAAVKHYGWTREQMRGKPISDINTLSPGEIKIALKEAVDGKRNLFHFQHRRANGSVSDVDILSGKILYRGRELLYSIVHDAGERRAIEEELAQERQRLQFILDAAAYGTWEWNLQTREVAINEILARMMGYSVDELKPTTTDLWRSHCHPDDFQRITSSLKDSLKEENRLFEHEQRMKHKDGHWVWTLARGRVVTRDINKEPLQMFGTLSSIQGRKTQEAEREALRDRLVQSQKMESVGRLAGGIAHDFNNLLTMILGHAESALVELGDEHPIACDLLKISDSAQKSAVLTRQLLTFARRQPATPELLNIDATLESLIDTLKESVGKQVSFLWSPGVGQALVKLDPTQLNQMIDHLISNAKEALPDGGTITLATAVHTVGEGQAPGFEKNKPGDYVVVTVRDNGIGMDEETLARLYEPFFTTKELGKGPGLGLSTVDGIVSQNQGFIQVQSKLREGSEFQIFLPVVFGQKPLPIKRAPTRKRSDKPQTVLIVEDEPSVLLLAERILKRNGYRVLCAELPEIAIDIFEANRESIDLLLTDVMMPGMDGPELVRNILKESPELKCLYMSGYSAETLAARGLLDGSVHLIEKPFRAKLMADKVREILDS